MLLIISFSPKPIKSQPILYLKKKKKNNNNNLGKLSLFNMGSWKSHIRVQLLQRDDGEKLPFVGIFTSLSQLQERFDIRKQIFDDIHSKSLEPEVGKTIDLQLQLRETEHLADKLSQTVSDLTSSLYLKEAELQYWRSRVSQYRHEALTLAKTNKNLKASLLEYEYTAECQSKELAALRLEQSGLKQASEQAHRDREQFLQRWMKEKEEAADRLNRYNDKQERCQDLSKRLKKCLRGERRKKIAPTAMSSLNGSDTTKNAQTTTDFQLQQESAIPLGS
ncbi:uncharacterized protein si:ch1073-143l10.2 [Austrofundulus limnaeus]|uniref:Uncharacterized protein LOC106513205 n=1 Tax=Austrofundulus limnaeus TaxID=52670 RepID=A0A2I4APF0_AUSLI|nr:PREDICTED: uncharacterized protein LOC106513205 [Austrofundulus limnaeus]XP_013857386.1 PREDICTED: uncharacterized protein LOC106513205 [Austrofundulus limnaeus]